jgi:hypothetical protein
VSPARYELGFYTREHGILHSDRRANSNLTDVDLFNDYPSQFLNHKRKQIHTNEVLMRVLNKIIMKCLVESELALKYNESNYGDCQFIVN